LITWSFSDLIYHKPPLYFFYYLCWRCSVTV